MCVRNGFQNSVPYFVPIDVRYLTEHACTCLYNASTLPTVLRYEQPRRPAFATLPAVLQTEAVHPPFRRFVLCVLSHD